MKKSLEWRGRRPTVSSTRSPGLQIPEAKTGFPFTSRSQRFASFGHGASGRRPRDGGVLPGSGDSRTRGGKRRRSCWLGCRASDGRRRSSVTHPPSGTGLLHHLATPLRCFPGDTSWVPCGGPGGLQASTVIVINGFLQGTLVPRAEPGRPRGRKVDGYQVGEAGRRGRPPEACAGFTIGAPAPRRRTRGRRETRRHRHGAQHLETRGGVPLQDSARVDRRIHCGAGCRRRAHGRGRPSP